MKKRNPTHQIFIRELFKQREITAQQHLAEIFKQQQTLTGYSNFFYKGQLYAHTKQKTNKLDKKLYPQMIDYLTYIDLLHKDKETVNKYLNLHKDKPVYYLVLIPAYSYITNYYNLQDVTPTIQAPPGVVNIINLNQLEQLL